MLDITLIREKPEWVKVQIQKLNDQEALARVDKIVELDAKRREIRTEVEHAQSFRNKLNKGMGKLRSNKFLPDRAKAALASSAAGAIGDNHYEAAIDILNAGTIPPVLNADLDLQAAFDQLIAALKALGTRLDDGFKKAKEIEAQLEANMIWIPNLPHESVPVFDNEEHNVAWEPEGENRTFEFEPKPHWELGSELGIIDFERGVKLSGTRFYILKGWGARLQRALINFYLDMARKKGFTELYVPNLVREDMMIGSAQFPKFRDVVYYDNESDLYMLPTAEVAITNMHRDEIFDEADLPRYYVAHTPCFRRERASAGKDTRGIKRGHQFEKVEMYKFTTPETSYAELESLTEAAADVCRALKIRFRRLEIVTGDLGFSASKKYDIEMWSPGCNEWLEVSSCSNTEAFQSRRAMVRYYPTGTKKSRFVHTLNGSGLATPRVIIAILENYQQADGSVLVPDVLRSYMGTDVISKA